MGETDEEGSEARLSRIDYGGSKSKYAVAFRLKHPLDEARNLATFKLVPKAVSERHKWDMRVRYVTLPGGGIDGGPEHAEQVIVDGLTQGHYEDASLDQYWIKWIYSERAPCLGRVDNACGRLLQRLINAQDEAADAPRLEIFYSFETDEEALREIKSAIDSLKEAGAEPLLVSRDKGRDSVEVEKRQRFYEAQLDKDIGYAVRHLGMSTGTD